MIKGTHGYIRKKKATQLIKTLIIFAISIITYVGGYLLNNNSKQNIFTILAVLIILPATKQLIGYIVFFPFHSVQDYKYVEVKSFISDNDRFYTDLVFTSSEKVMNLSFLVLRGNSILGFSEYNKSNIKYIKEYLQKIIQGSNLSYQVLIMKDYSEFLTALKQVEIPSDLNLKTEEIHKNIMSILV